MFVTARLTEVETETKSNLLIGKNAYEERPVKNGVSLKRNSTAATGGRTPLGSSENSPQTAKWKQTKDTARVCCGGRSQANK